MRNLKRIWSLLIRESRHFRLDCWVDVGIMRDMNNLKLVKEKVRKDYPQFEVFPASISKHHCYRGGLKQHTEEVVEIASSMAGLSIRRGSNINLDAILIGAYLHDIGKINVYRCIDGGFVKGDNYSASLHIYESINIAEKILGELGLGGLFPKVKSIISAHHGRKEWGSIKEPSSKEEWIVHLADMASVFGVESRNA